MSRTFIIALVVLVAAVSSAATALIVNSTASNQTALSQVPRAFRQKFFGSDKEPPPIKDGQEIGPRW